MEIPPVINPFKHMIMLQEQLVRKFIPLERLPMYPIDLNTRAGQRIIKDFVRRFTEELAEAYISITKANEAMSANQIMEAQAHCREYNTEIADANHFLLEILIYSGLDNSIIDSLIYHYLYDRMGMKSLYDSEDTLGNILKLGKFYNQQVDFGKHTMFKIFDINQNSEFPEYSGGSEISPPALINHSHLLWELTCQLNMAANELNTRDHHQTEREVNLLNYKEMLLYTLIAWGRYLDYAKFTQRGIYNMYFIKNKMNHERIAQGY